MPNGKQSFRVEEWSGSEDDKAETRHSPRAFFESNFFLFLFSFRLVMKEFSISFC